MPAPLPDLCRVPAGTTEITYAGPDGAQVAIKVKTEKSGTFAYPVSQRDWEVLEGFGWFHRSIDIAPPKADEATSTAEEG